MLEDLTKISSTVIFFGKTFISEILYLEQFICFGISFSKVSGSTICFCNAKATVNVLNTEPSSKTPLVILFIYLMSEIFL